jgi:hypothetical protein
VRDVAKAWGGKPPLVGFVEWGERPDFSPVSALAEIAEEALSPAAPVPLTWAGLAARYGLNCVVVPDDDDPSFGRLVVDRDAVRVEDRADAEPWLKKTEDLKTEDGRGGEKCGSDEATDDRLHTSTGDRTWAYEAIARWFYDRGVVDGERGLPDFEAAVGDWEAEKS